MTGDRTVLPPQYHTDWHPITYHTTVTCDCTCFYFEIFIEIHKIDFYEDKLTIYAMRDDNCGAISYVTARCTSA